MKLIKVENQREIWNKLYNKDTNIFSGYRHFINFQTSEEDGYWRRIEVHHANKGFFKSPSYLIVIPVRETEIMTRFGLFTVELEPGESLGDVKIQKRLESLFKTGEYTEEFVNLVQDGYGSSRYELDAVELILLSAKEFRDRYDNHDNRLSQDKAEDVRLNMNEAICWLEQALKTLKEK